MLKKIPTTIQQKILNCLIRAKKDEIKMSILFRYILKITTKNKETNIDSIFWHKD